MNQMTERRPPKSRRRGSSRLFSLVGLLALGPAFGGCDAGPRLVHGSGPEKPVLDRGPQTVGIREVWRTNIASEFDIVGGMASWPDGTIWVGDSRNLALWELRPDGSQPRAVTWANSESERVDRVSRISVANDSLFLVWGYGGIDVGARRRPEAARHLQLPRFSAWRFAAPADGGFIVSGGGYPDDDFFDHSVHRYDALGNHVNSWHSVFPHDDWRATRRLSGGALGLTASGELLVSDVAPFRIVKYVGLDPASRSLVVEDESIISSAELTRALAPDDPQVTFQFRWNRSTFVGEMPDGNILNVSLYYGRRSRPYSLWTVVTPRGDILASTRHDKAYDVWSRAPDGTYLASYDEHAIKLEVSVGPGREERVGHLPRMNDMAVFDPSQPGGASVVPLAALSGGGPNTPSPQGDVP